MSAIARNLTRLLCLLLAPLLSKAALPELSSLEPLEFDESSQRLIAKGDARLDFGDTKIRADRITYYQEFAIADADGNVAINQDGNRIIADNVSYDASDGLFSADILRSGRWPYYLGGVSAGGTRDDTTVNGATVYYGNPGPFTVNVSSDEVAYVKEEDSEHVSMDRAVFRVGNIPIFYLPSYRHYVTDTPYFLDVNAGSGSGLGTYLQTTTLFPATPWLRAGANLDYYSKRGPLAGPTAQYIYNTSTQTITGAINSGYINDSANTSERGVDTFGREIGTERGFAEWRHKHHVGEHFTATATASYWSDSEVTRDFREDIYDDDQRPDNYIEAVYAGDNWMVSAFGRFRPNGFQLVQERLPEIRADLLPVPILETGAYHKASISYVTLREDFNPNATGISVASQTNRLDLTYRIQRPFLLTNWLTFTPLSGIRLTEYNDQEIDPFFADPADIKDSHSRHLYELGFDLEARAFAHYPTVNQTWDIDGLRHIVQPALRYRYFSASRDFNKIAKIDRKVFDLDRPLLDLSDLRHVDDIPETHLVRLGIENLFQTRAENYGSRTLAALNFYQDILFEKDTRYDGEKEDTFNATWLELVLNPAPWLKFDLASRFKTESFSLEELRTRTTIRSGEIWEVGLSTDLLNNQIEQYRLNFIYRVSERYAFLTDVRFDADKGDFNRLQLGLRTRFGSAWEVLYAITFREDASRESDVEFRIQLRLSQDD